MKTYHHASSFIKANHSILILITIIVLGSFLRLKGLTFQSYWMDELFSADYCDPSKSFFTMLDGLSKQHPPLYSTLLWSWYSFFGYTEFVGRLLSTVLGVLSVIAIYFLGRDLFNRHVGLYASLLSSINPFLIYHSQEVRSYSLFFLMTILSYLFFYRVINDSSKKNIFLYWTATILLLYTHYFSFFLLGSQVFVMIYYLLKFPEDRKKLLMISFLTFIVLTLLFLPVVFKYLLQIEQGSPDWIPRPHWYFFVGLVSSYFPSNYKLLQTLLAVSGLLSLIAFFSGRLEDQERSALTLLMIWIVIGLAIPYVISLTMTPILVRRYMIYVLPALILFFSYGVWRLSEWKRYLFLGLIVLISLTGLYDRGYYHVKTKEQYREVIQKIRTYSPLPIYNAMTYERYNHGDTNFYQVYANLLRMDTKIHDHRRLHKDLAYERLPQCFWIVDAHNSDDIEQLGLLENKSITQVYEIKGLQRARGVLFAYKIEPEICAKRMNLKGW